MIKNLDHTGTLLYNTLRVNRWWTRGVTAHYHIRNYMTSLAITAMIPQIVRIVNNEILTVILLTLPYRYHFG